MPIRQLDSPQNPTIKAVAKLRTSRGRHQTGQIIIDGEREIRRATQSGLALEAIFVEDGSDVEPWQPLAPNIYEVSKRAHEKIAFGQRLEPVAIAARPDTSLETFIPADKISEDATFVVLEAVEKPGNIGAVLRSADGAGVDGVLLVDPLADIYNPNAIRASLGTVFAVPVATTTFSQYQAWATQHAITSLLAVCDASAQDYSQIDYEGRVAIVLGSEATGLHGRWGDIGNSSSMMLPMRGIADSLNVAAAATVFMYEATRRAKR